jgi:hypothetical protein
VFVRLSRFRTTRPAFDAVLRTTVLPRTRARSGNVAVFAGRQGPDEIGARLLASLWIPAASSNGPGAPAAAGSEADAGAEDALDGTAGQSTEVMPVVLLRLAAAPLATGILRVARGHLRDLDVASYAQDVSRDITGIQALSAGPSDLVMATPGEGSFVMLTTWRDWSAIEAATGASISEPLRTKQLPALESFEADHFELLSELPAVPD